MRTIWKVALAAGVVTGAAVLVTSRYVSRLAASRWDGPRTAHFNGSRFFNPGVRNVQHSPAEFIRWMATRQQGPWYWRDIQPSTPEPRIADHGRAAVTMVNHATVLIQTDGLNILTDPVWSDRVSPLESLGPMRHHAPGITFDHLPKIDVVVLSHNHYDHLDVGTLQRLVSRDRPIILAPLGNADYLRRFGIEGARDLDWWDRREIKGVSIVSVPVRHWSGRAVRDRNHTLWSGWVVESSAGKIFFAGDTGYGGHFAEIRETLGPMRLALLPIGAYLPRWFMKEHHLSPSDAIQAHLDLEAEEAIPIHFGCFALGDDGQDEAAGELTGLVAQMNPSPRFRILDPGATRRIEPAAIRSA